MPSKSPRIETPEPTRSRPRQLAHELARSSRPHRASCGRASPAPAGSIRSAPSPSSKPIWWPSTPCNGSRPRTAPPAAEERQALQRYTGWGGLPASFNLDTDEPAWAERARRLQDLLPPEDYASARASVNNSHYTEIHVIEAMWQAILGFGFSGGRVLEPAAGIGHFIGAMPENLAERSTVTAIEIDHLSGRILQALYAPGGADVRIAPFEKTPLPENWFDLVIGNVPFGKYQVADQSNRAYAHYSIHNYFLGRALDLVRPGGLVCLITSSHTLESRQETVRQYLASQAHLLGAIRLPKGAFAGIAATEAQTDILFLRKRQRSETVEAEWLDITAVPNELRHPLAPPNRYLPINEWYMRHPEFCIGRIRSESNGYEEVPMAVFEGDLEATLLERIALLPTGVFEPVKHVATHRCGWSYRPRRVPAPAASACIKGGCIGSKAVNWSMSMISSMPRSGPGSPGCARSATMPGPCSMPSWPMRTMVRLDHLRAMLNGTYDRFVAKYGCLTARANALAFRRDPDYPLLLSLEHYDEESGTARKAALFTQRT
jgi:hypothetical protein